MSSPSGGSGNGNHAAVVIIGSGFGGLVMAHHLKRGRTQRMGAVSGRARAAFAEFGAWVFDLGNETGADE